MRYSYLKFGILSMVLLLACSFNASAQDEAAIKEGKQLFQNNCGSCHNKNMKDDMTGPALAGVEERWAAYPREDLYAWIRNSQSMVSAGHPRAAELWSQWKPTLMNNFPQLTDPQIENILAYIKCTAAGNCPGTPPPPPPGGGDAVSGAGTSDNTGLLIVLGIILAFLAVVLARIVSNLNYLVDVREGKTAGARKTLVQILTSKTTVAFAIFALVVLGGYTTVNRAVKMGRQQGYMPEQPIKFSHAIHAGDQKIDCQYCHDGARRSKHSVIPAANTCMNCHRAVKVGTLDGTAELTKIFASVGYDPSKDKYIEGYDKMSEAEIEKIYKSWIADNYIKEKGSLDMTGEKQVEEQWEGIVKALTDKENGDDKIYGPIEWLRIHNLPDHVYFNHAQHVAVGKVACQTCHGKIEEMDVVEQKMPLSMGWCVNCHRQTEVKFTDNEYYKTYERFHDELAKGKRTKVTVEEIGGLECQKCHY